MSFFSLRSEQFESNITIIILKKDDFAGPY